MTEVKIEGFDSIIREAVEQRIRASIAESLDSERDGIVERVVRTALEAKVKDGYRELPFLEKLSRDTIQEATEAVVSEWVMGLVQEIRAAIEKQLGTQKARTALARS